MTFLVINGVELKAKEVLLFYKSKKGIRPVSAPLSHAKLVGQCQGVDEREREIGDVTSLPPPTTTSTSVPLCSPIKKAGRPASSPTKRTASAGGTRR